MSERAVVVVDDDPGVLDSITSLLTLEGYRVARFSSAMAFLDEVRRLSILCVIIDIRMPQIDGMTLIKRLRDMELDSIPTIVISGHADIPLAVAAMQLGAITVLEKPFMPDRLLEAVTAAQEKLHPPLTSPETKEVRARYETLSPRERQVLSHLLAGSSSKAAAIPLGISPRTVDVFRANILRKMNAPNLAALATQTSKAGLQLA